MTTKTFKVKAGGRGPVILEGHPQRQLDENGNDVNVIRDKPVEVPNTRYYRRLLADRDLVLVSDMDAGKKKKGDSLPPSDMDAGKKE